MKFYLYPNKKINYKIKWDYDKFFFDRWFKESYSALLKHSNRTDSPKEADLNIDKFLLL